MSTSEKKDRRPHEGSAAISAAAVAVMEATPARTAPLATTRPDPEVVERPSRRTFTAEFKALWRPHLAREHPDRFLARFAARDALLDTPDGRLVDLDGAAEAVTPGRTIAPRSLCSQVQAVSSLPNPSMRWSPNALTPSFWLVTYHIAWN